MVISQRSTPCIGLLILGRYHLYPTAQRSSARHLLRKCLSVCVATFKRHRKTLLLTAAYGVTDNLTATNLIRNSNYYVAPLHFKVTLYVFSAAVQFCKERYTNTSL